MNCRAEIGPMILDSTSINCGTTNCIPYQKNNFLDVLAKRARVMASQTRLCAPARHTALSRVSRSPSLRSGTMPARDARCLENQVTMRRSPKSIPSRAPEMNTLLIRPFDVLTTFGIDTKLISFSNKQGNCHLVAGFQFHFFRHIRRGISTNSRWRFHNS